MSENFDVNSFLDLAGIPGVDIDDTMPVVYEPTVLEPVNSNPTNRSVDLESDYSFVREQFHYQQQMMMAMAKIALENAKNSESPKHVEVFTQLMGTMANTTKSIIAVHKEMANITNETTATKKDQSNQQGNISIENATVFVGTPSELMAMEGSQSDALSGMTVDGEHEEND